MHWSAIWFFIANLFHANDQPTETNLSRSHFHHFTCNLNQQMLQMHLHSSVALSQLDPSSRPFCSDRSFFVVKNDSGRRSFLTNRNPKIDTLNAVTYGPSSYSYVCWDVDPTENPCKCEGLWIIQGTNRMECGHEEGRISWRGETVTVGCN